MQVGFDGAGAEEGFAETSEVVVSVDVEPEELGELGNADGF